VRRGAALGSGRGHPLLPTSTPCCKDLWWVDSVRECNTESALRGGSVCELACGDELLRPATSGDPFQAGACGVAATADEYAPGRGPGGAGAGPDRQHRGRADRRPWVSERVRVRAAGALGLVADRDEQPPWPFPDWGSPDPLEDEPLPDALLRFGVQFADGRKVTNLDMYPFVPEGLPPNQPVLVEGGGVGQFMQTAYEASKSNVPALPTG
jgi:hypothetical protein